jgi:hypothetical protein
MSCALPSPRRVVTCVPSMKTAVSGRSFCALSRATNVTLGWSRVMSSTKRAQSLCTSAGHVDCAQVRKYLPAWENCPASRASWPLPCASTHSSFEGGAAEATDAASRIEAAVVLKRTTEANVDIRAPRPAAHRQPGLKIFFLPSK